MKLEKFYSHLNGLEFLQIKKPELLEEVKLIIELVDASKLRTKVSREKTMKDRVLYSPTSMNAKFREYFRSKGWGEERYQYYVTTNPVIAPSLLRLDIESQLKALKESGELDPIHSYKQTDFVKDRVGVEVQFGKYSFVAYDLFVKHLFFYSGYRIDVGVEILPVKELQKEMSSGVPYYEGELHNILVQGRNVPAVPLVILGIAP